MYVPISVHEGCLITDATEHFFLLIFRCDQLIRQEVKERFRALPLTRFYAKMKKNALSFCIEIYGEMWERHCCITKC